MRVYDVVWRVCLMCHKHSAELMGRSRQRGLDLCHHPPMPPTLPPPHKLAQKQDYHMTE